MLIWIKFIICSVAIIWCGYKASYLGDVLCEKTRVTRTIMGFAVLAGATSAPEFVTSVASIVVVKLPDFAAGDLFGSLIFNLGIIALLDLIEGEGPLMLKVHTKQILYAGWTVIFLSVIVFFMLLRIFTDFSFHLLGLGWESFLLPFLLIVALFSIFKMEKTEQKDATTSFVEKIYKHLSFRTTLFKFIFYLLAIVGLGIWLSQIGKEIVFVMRWSEVMVGTFFLGIVTSFPELIVSISALKFDVDMAVGNILGSNFFDTMIVPLCDALLREGVFLSSIRMENLLTVILAIVLSNILIIGLISRSKRCFLKLGWDAISMVLVLIGGSSILFFLTK
ncbi:hypothetical protein IBX65_05010 [Candidatus Aerophobetes bacterium]|nr:hypothetical protein [Candidatus Aerophobetes bacterium]